MTGNLLKRLEKIEEQMNPPELPKVRIQVVFVRPDGSVSSTMMIESGKSDVITRDDEDD